MPSVIISPQSRISFYLRAFYYVRLVLLYLKNMKMFENFKELYTPKNFNNVFIDS